MNEYQNYIEAFRMFMLNPEADKCKCHGSGWASTDFDTWERCPYHYKNRKETPHPEDDGIPDAPSCTECWDGENYPPDKCPKCGMHIRKQLYENDPTPGEPMPPDDWHNNDKPEEEIPF